MAQVLWHRTDPGAKRCSSSCFEGMLPPAHDLSFAPWCSTYVAGGSAYCQHAICCTTTQQMCTCMNFLITRYLFLDFAGPITHLTVSCWALQDQARLQVRCGRHWQAPGGLAQAEQQGPLCLAQSSTLEPSVEPQMQLGCC